MRDYINAIKTEWIKLKHSGTFWICLGASAFVPVLQTIAIFFISKTGERPQSDMWNVFIKNNFSSFTGFFFPLFLVIIVARVVYLEHRSDTWKLLETQPVSRLSLFMAKWSIAIFISLICLLGVLLFSIIGGSVLQVFLPKKGFDFATINGWMLLKVISRYWIASFGIIAIQYFLGLWNKSFALPLSIGLVATIAGSIMAGFGVWTWWPYAAPSFTSSLYEGSLTGQFLLHQEKMSVLWAIIFLIAGYQLFIRKSFVRAFFIPVARLGLTFLVIFFFIATAYFLNKPQQLNKYTRTIVSGSIKSEKKIVSVAVLRQPAMDTVLIIPVDDSKFHGIINDSLATGLYIIRAGGLQQPVYFGYLDSIYMDIKVDKFSSSVSVSGTRVAENEYLKNESRDYELYSLTNFPYDFSPEEYANQLLSVWQNGLKQIKEFQTADHIQPQSDFIAVQEKLLAIKLLQLATVTYPQVFNLYHPNEKYKFPAKLETLRKSADINAEGLVSFSEFTDYMADVLRQEAGPADSAYVDLIQSKISNQRLRDVLIFKSVSGKLGKIMDSAIRQQYLTAFLPYLKDDALKRLIVLTNNKYNNLQRGKQAYVFSGEALGGNEIILAQLANRYVVIDVWATWCGPCKRESPYFENLAEKYASEKVSFIALSIDEDKKAWKMQAPYKSKRVLQLWAKNGGEDFSKEYAVSTIPRFMLIDPKGKIVNVNMPPPSDPLFEKILLQEIPSLYVKEY